jgi:hypothetical protein
METMDLKRLLLCAVFNRALDLHRPDGWTRKTLDALRSPDANLGYVPPTPRRDQTWIPVRKFKHGQWIMKWKKYQRHWDENVGYEAQQANSVYESNAYTED